jgi:sulfate/thiosulfate transport system substrate-binding protein
MHTVVISSQIQAQGPLIERLPDGRLLIDGGGRRVAGQPLVRERNPATARKAAIAAVPFGIGSFVEWRHRPRPKRC